MVELARHCGLNHFNPRTPVGCDISTGEGKHRHSQFQSTHPSGVRHGVAWEPCPAVLRFQSTHPSGVRRFASALVILYRRYFNPRTPVGCDLITINVGPIIQISIHAPQWGATSSRRIWPAPNCYFNPRTPVGCDITALRDAQRLWISIHAPQWGATRLDGRQRPADIISIHAPQWGATGGHQWSIGRPDISIHAPQWGATRPSGPRWFP